MFTVYATLYVLDAPVFALSGCKSFSQVVFCTCAVVRAANAVQGGHLGQLEANAHGKWCCYQCYLSKKMFFDHKMLNQYVRSCLQRNELDQICTRFTVSDLKEILCRAVRRVRRQASGRSSTARRNFFKCWLARWLWRCCLLRGRRKALEEDAVDAAYGGGRAGRLNLECVSEA